jgi:glycosyltransferase involved in cell wall biosynthesis
METQSPIISVVIPCRNERDHIEGCIRSILAQEPMPGGFEVIVADGMSDDGTREILSTVFAVNRRLRIIENPSRITPCGMNAGILQSCGEYIAIMGAHNVYAPDYLRSSLAVAQETAADNVGGSVTCLGESRLQKAIAIAHHSRFSAGGARWHDPHYEGPADTVFGGFYRRQVFERIGLFDESLVRNQDDEFNLRLTRAGGKIWHSPRIKSWYCPRASLGALFQQYMQYGYWKVRVVQKHGKPASLRHLVPGAFAFCTIVLPTVAMVNSAFLWIWLGLASTYLCCNLSVSFIAAARHGWSYFPRLPAVFGCYHFGYGLGFLKGIVDFVVLRRVPSNRFMELTRSSV